ncbi:hypothetical protein ACLKMH_19820 [Psychromonas sp. KJ10-10]|uniref:hypothetical protein n=1 Tax=Psychromonas sp. KJ10-10 TaxID=3391823 RepID=UPI0039B469AB
MSANYKNYESDYNYIQHCNLIDNLLRLIEECAEHHHLLEHIYSNKDNSNILWSQLLITAEHIGQARAIGTSIATRKEFNNIQRLKLGSLRDSINEFLFLQICDNAPIDDLLNAINKQILIPTPSISAEEYFNKATIALELVLKRFDDHLENLKSTI